MMKTTLFLITAGIVFLCNSTVNGKTFISEPRIQPVYIKAGTQLTLKCEQNNNYNTRWSRLSRVNNAGESAGYLTLSIDSGFNETTFEVGGHQVNSLVKKSVEVSDSGSFKCEVSSGLDNSYSVEVYVVNIIGINDTMRKVGGEAMLQCLALSEESVAANFLWYRNNELILQEQRKYAINSSSGPDPMSTLHISRLGESDIGEYECRVALGNNINFSHPVYLFSIPFVRAFEKSRTLVQGDSLDLECRFWGLPIPTVTWFRNSDNLSTKVEPHVTFRNSSHLINGVLRISNVTYKDRANYTCCTLSYVNGTVLTSSASIFIRIKGKMAALYPLIGIAVEAIALVVIILIYERRRRKQRKKELSDSADNLIGSCDRSLDDQISLRI